MSSKYFLHKNHFTDWEGHLTVYYTINGVPKSWNVDMELELANWYEVEIKQSKRDEKVKSWNYFANFLLLEIFQFLFEIIIEGENRKNVVNNKDTGYDDVKVYVSIDEDIEGMGTVYVMEIQYTKGDGQVFNRFSKNYKKYFD